MIMSDRVRTLMDAAGLSQSELARRIQVTQGAIAKIASSNPGGSSHLHKIARELGTTPAYLTGETDDPSAGALPVPTAGVIADQLDLVQINEVSLDYGMGGSYLDAAVELTPRYFPTVWLRSVTDTPPEALFFARGRGDSMQPTLLDGDMVLIDRSERQVREQDRIWAIAYGEIGSIKRVRISGGGVKVLSDNPSVREEVLAPDEVTIIGRVVWIGRKI